MRGDYFAQSYIIPDELQSKIIFKVRVEVHKPDNLIFIIITSYSLPLIAHPERLK